MSLSFMKKGDVILIVIVLTAAALIYGGFALTRTSEEAATGSRYAQIQVDGSLYKTVKLTKETQTIRIETERGYDVLRVRDYGIEVIESDCPQKICFTFGLITKPHQEIICLPLRMYITVISDTPSDQDELDAIVS